MKSIRAFIVLSSLLSGFSLKSQILYSNNFATSLGTATASGGASGNWLWNNTCAQVNTVGHSIGGVATFSGSSCQYGNGGNTVSGNLTTAPVSIGSSGAVLTFNYFLNTECQNAGGTCYYDVLTLQISNNGGTTWTNIMASNGPPLGLVHTTAWQPIVYSLNTYSNQTVLIRFNFNSIDGIGNAYDGVYVDDIIVTSNCFISLTSLPGNSTVTPVICAGQSLTLTTNAVSNYSWSSGATTQSIVVSPTVSTQYSIVATSSANCSSSNTLSVIVNALPVISVNNGTICAGQSFTISPNGANTYTIQGGNAIVSPSINTTYTVAGTSTAGCVSQAFITSSLLVNPNPIITVNNGTICAGQTFTINPNGANTYTIQGATAVVSPSVNTTYTVAGTSTAGCVSQALTTSSLTVNSLPVITITGTTAVCAGLSVSLTAGGASTYTWSTGSNSSSVVVTPSITSGSFTYNVVGSSSVGCTRTKVDSILVRAVPNLTITGGNYVCNGNTLNLNVSGASTYSWNTGSTSNSIAVSPSVNTSYSVVGTSTAGCKRTSVNNVTVVSIPTVAITGNTVICFGDSLTLVANGANTYTWSTGSTNSVVVVTPSTATTYSLVGAIGVGCVNSSQTAISVNTLPSLSLTASSKTICLGETTTIAISGATSYTWSTAANTTSISVSPTITSTYSVVGKDGNDCSSKDSLTLVVSLCSSVSEADWLSKTTRVYPSPNNGVFTIEVPEADGFEIVVTNTLGQRMVAIKANSVNTIDLMNLDNGIYFIHVLQNNTIVYRNSIIKE